MNSKVSYKKSIFFTSIGTFLEWYEFGIFGYVAIYLTQSFLPAESPFLMTVYSFGIFGLGYVARPIGGLIFGHLGDLRGRNYVIIVSSLIMSFSMLFTALIPSYKTIGWLAVLLLIVSRLVQGASTGGEYTGTLVSLMEQSDKYGKGKKNNRGFIGSYGTFLSNVGFFASLIIVNILSELLTKQEMLSWGWRIPFVIGFILGLIFFILRLNIKETINVSKSKGKTKAPIFLVFKNHKKVFFLSTIITLLSNTLYYVYFIFFPSLNRLHGLKGDVSINIVLFIFAFLILLAGFSSDYIGRKKMLFFSSILSIIAIIILLVLHIESILIYISVLSIFYAFVLGSANLIVVEIFPESCRLTGFGFSYNIANAIGGFTPMVCMIIFHDYHNFGSILIFLIIVLILMFLMSLFIKEPTFEKLKK